MIKWDVKIGDEIKFFDLQKEQGNAWKFVEMYGDLHGVKEARQNSVRAEILTLMNSPHRLADSEAH